MSDTDVEYPERSNIPARSSPRPSSPADPLQALLQQNPAQLALDAREAEAQLECEAARFFANPRAALGRIARAFDEQGYTATIEALARHPAHFGALKTAAGPPNTLAEAAAAYAKAWSRRIIASKSKKAAFLQRAGRYVTQGFALLYKDGARAQATFNEAYRLGTRAALEALRDRPERFGTLQDADLAERLAPKLSGSVRALSHLQQHELREEAQALAILREQARLASAERLDDP